MTAGQWRILIVYVLMCAWIIVFRTLANLAE